MSANFYKSLIEKMSSVEKTASTKEVISELDDNMIETIAEEIGIVTNKIDSSTIQSALEKKAEESEEKKEDTKEEEKKEEKKKDEEERQAEEDEEKDEEDKKEDKEEKKKEEMEDEEEKEASATEILYGLLKEAAEAEYREKFAQDIFSRLEKIAEGEMTPDELAAQEAMTQQAPAQQMMAPQAPGQDGVDEYAALVEEVMQYVGDEGLATKIVEVGDGLSQQSGIPIEEIIADLIDSVLEELSATEVAEPTPGPALQ